jgi:hypothetical protein
MKKSQTRMLLTTRKKKWDKIRPIMRMMRALTKMEL